MQPPSPTPPSATSLVLGLWAASMVPLGLAATLGSPWYLLALVVPVVWARLAYQGGPPPQAAVRALASAGHRVGFDGPYTRVVDHRSRRLRLHRPKALRHDGRFLVAVPHTLPLADHTWVAMQPTGHQTRHAPWDLRTRMMFGLYEDWSLHPARVVLTDEAVEFHLPLADASDLSDRVDALIDWTERLEQRFDESITLALECAGMETITTTTGPEGTRVFRGTYREAPVVVRFGRFRGDQPAWRGRPELRVRWRAQETLFIGPCTRSIFEDVRSVWSPEAH